MSNLGLILGYASLKFQDEDYWRQKMYDLRLAKANQMKPDGPTASQMMSLYGNILGVYNKDKLHPVAKEEADKQFIEISKLAAEAVQDPTKRALFISSVPEFIRRYNTIQRDSEQFTALEKDVKEGKSLIPQEEYDAWVSTPGAYNIADSFFDVKLFSKNENGGYSYSPEIRIDKGLKEFADEKAENKMKLRTGDLEITRVSKQFPNLISVNKFIKKEDVDDIVREYFADENKAKYLAYKMYKDIEIGKPFNIITQAGAEIADDFETKSFAVEATMNGVAAVAPFLADNTRAFSRLIQQSMAENALIYNREKGFRDEVLPLLSRDPGLRTAIASGNKEYIDSMPVSMVAKTILKEMTENVEKFKNEYSAVKESKVMTYYPGGGGGSSNRVSVRYRTIGNMDRSGKFFYVRGDMTGAKEGQAVRSNITVETNNYIPVGEVFNGVMDIDLSPLKRGVDGSRQSVMMNMRFDDLSLYALPVTRKAIRMPDGVFIPANTPLDINTLSRIREQYPESYQGAVGAKLYSLGFSQVAGKTAVFAVPFEEISNQAYAVYGRAVDKMINDLVKNFEENLHVKPRFINFEKRFEVK